MMAARKNNLPAFAAGLRGQLLADEPMSRHTTWRVGGAAEFFFTPADKDDLIKLLTQLPPPTPLTWVGLGSNLLVRDGGVTGVVVRTAKGLSATAFTPPDQLYVEAGVACAKVARASVAHGRGGAEFLAGVPGTFGGALAMNAGAFGGETWDLVHAIECVNRDGGVKTFSAADIHVGYRRADIPDGWWLLAGTLSLPTAAADGKQRIRSLLEKRGATQPVQSANAGSVFQNPDSDFAARLLDAAGMKGARVGGASVSSVHANFIVNDGDATAADIEKLIQRAQRKVKDHSGVELTQEVRIIGDAK